MHLNFGNIKWSWWSFYSKNVEFIGLVSPFLAVLDPNSFGLILTFHWYWKPNKSEYLLHERLLWCCFYTVGTWTWFCSPSIWEYSPCKIHVCKAEFRIYFPLIILDSILNMGPCFVYENPWQHVGTTTKT